MSMDGLHCHLFPGQNSIPDTVWPFLLTEWMGLTAAGSIKSETFGKIRMKTVQSVRLRVEMGSASISINHRSHRDELCLGFLKQLLTSRTNDFMS